MDKTLELLCDNLISPDNETMDIWQWGQGVAIFALEQAYKKTHNERYIEYIKSWTDGQLGREKPGYSINTSAPLNGVLALHELCGDDKWFGLCGEFADYLLGENPRCERGVFEHTCTGNNCPNQMWVDTAMMAGVFLVRYGLITGKRMYVNEALRQIKGHYDFLHDEQTGLLYHGYYSDDRKCHGSLWGRGNAWFAVACPVILSMTDDSYPLKKDIERIFKSHISALIGFQREDGSWGTVINDPSSYSESSGTAGAAYGIAKAVELGYIDRKYEKNRDMALEYLKGKISADGTMTGGSDGTCVTDDINIYKNTKLRKSEFTQGLAILAFTV